MIIEKLSFAGYLCGLSGLAQSGHSTRQKVWEGNKVVQCG